MLLGRRAIFRQYVFLKAPPLLAQIDVKFWRQSLNSKVLMYQNTGHEYHLCLLLNFPRAAILNSYDVMRLPTLLHTKMLLLNNSGNHMAS